MAMSCACSGVSGGVVREGAEADGGKEGDGGRDVPQPASTSRAAVQAAARPTG